MRRSLPMLAALGLLATAVPALAQDAAPTPGQPPQNARRGRANRPGKLAELDAALRAAQLTPEQRQKLDEVYTKLEAGILATLTPEQQTRFKAAQATFAAGNSRFGGAALATQLNDELMLTAEQKQKVEPILGEYQKGLADKLRGVSPQERRAIQQEAFTALKTQIRPLLTPEQQTKLDAWQPRGGGRGARNAAPTPNP